MKVLLPALVILLFACNVEAKVLTKTIEYRHGDALLQGYLAWDDAVKGKRPGVLVVHEWWGHNAYVRHRAEQLAQLGYVAFALDMYGKGILAKTPEEAGKLAGQFKNDRPLGRARARAGLDVLLQQELTDPARVAAVGYCFGGTTVLEMARGGAPLAGVVSFHGGLDTPLPAQPGAIKAKVLVLHGADDPFVPAEQITVFENEMRQAGADWQLVKYGGAVHSFTNPESDSYNLKGAAYNKKADMRSWEAMRAFFGEIFRLPSAPSSVRVE
ncbi:dienelactone hydrolase family protein [Geobacter sp. AOG1]|uniref:dienelactone hydrolase family protein n=1 Tax=Geobacter sp. AOG1 TaxID=1566346 RepID=UPI001CC3C323|nr:dienelactone hydrolase family protein [Geobacter sp. AOG1]GFE56475.1 dienelactone hydrolase [Geobacter sp. AOG1]